MKRKAKAPSKHSCPQCSSADIYRSRRQGLVEKYILPALRLRPYRCIDCNNRFYDFPHVQETRSHEREAVTKLEKFNAEQTIAMHESRVGYPQKSPQ